MAWIELASGAMRCSNDRFPSQLHAPSSSWLLPLISATPTLLRYHGKLLLLPGVPWYPTLYCSCVHLHRIVSFVLPLADGDVCIPQHDMILGESAFRGCNHTRTCSTRSFPCSRGLSAMSNEHVSLAQKRIFENSVRLLFLWEGDSWVMLSDWVRECGNVVNSCCVEVFICLS